MEPAQECFCGVEFPPTRDEAGDASEFRATDIESEKVNALCVEAGMDVVWSHKNEDADDEDEDVEMNCEDNVGDDGGHASLRIIT